MLIFCASSVSVTALLLLFSGYLVIRFSQVQRELQRRTRPGRYRLPPPQYVELEVTYCHPVLWPGSQRPNRALSPGQGSAAPAPLACDPPWEELVHFTGFYASGALGP